MREQSAMQTAQLTESQKQAELPSLLAKSEARNLRWLLLASSICLLVGMIAPMMTLSKFMLVKNTVSVFSGLGELIRSGHFILFLVVAGFSVILPLLKITVLFNILSSKPMSAEKITRNLHLMHEYGRWAMLDVLVVAVLIVTVKLGAIASIKIHFGLYIFAAAVILIMLITTRVVRLTERLRGIENERS